MKKHMQTYFKKYVEIGMLTYTTLGETAVFELKICKSNRIPFSQIKKASRRGIIQRKA